ncbi:O-antigen ligase family protein [Mariniplasma anaerobium]|uniref:O-antigen ligase family protein n=1 Tax=Mariniplasma anaerobium TaxID=2735436 RepID=UPI0015932E75
MESFKLINNSIKKQNRLLTKIIPLFLVISIFFSTINIRFVGEIESYLIILILSIISLVLNKNKLMLMDISIVFLVFLMFFISALRLITYKQTYEFFIYFITFISISFSLSYSKKWHYNFIKYSYIILIIFVAITYFSVFFPVSYENFIIPLFSDYSQEIVRKLIYYNNEHSGLTSQISFNSFFISFGIGIILSRIITNKRNTLNYFLIIIFIIALFYTGKRSIYIASIVASLIMIFISISNRKRKNLHPAASSFMIFGAVFIVLFSIILYFSFNNYDYDILNELSSNRLNLYAEAFNLIQDKIFFGHGLYSAPIYLDNVFTVEISQIHNIYIQLLFEMGIFFSLIIIVLLFTFYYRTLKLLASNANNGVNYNIYLYISFYCQSLWLLYGLFGNPLTTYPFLIIYLLSISITQYYYRINRFMKINIKM